MAHTSELGRKESTSFVSSGILSESLQVSGKGQASLTLLAGASQLWTEISCQYHQGVKWVTPHAPQPQPSACTGAFSHFAVTGTIRGDGFYF